MIMHIELMPRKQTFSRMQVALCCRKCAAQLMNVIVPALIDSSFTHEWQRPHPAADIEAHINLSPGGCNRIDIQIGNDRAKQLSDHVSN